HHKNSRNLIICIDGTANQFGDQNTNVIELYNLLLKGPNDRQLTWYNSGIGTYAEPHWRSLEYWLQVLYHKIDLLIAWNFDKTLLAAYRWLADNYEEGDRIYLFGFSRGAFQVRALSAMIDKVGLIYKGNELQIPLCVDFTSSIYKIFSFGNSPKVVKKVGTGEYVSKTERFKKAFAREVRVHFVGAWDTVSSIGIARGKRVLPGTTDGMRHVCYFRHALALDERRVKFLPEYAWGGSHNDRRMKDTSKQETRDSDQYTWFPGTHSDIGGGNRQNEGMDRSRPPLRWMVSEAKAAGLRTREFDRELLPKEHIEIKESLNGVWHLFELLPFVRLTYTARLQGRVLTRRPHCWASRKIHPGQKIHPAVLVEEMRTSYLPQARLASQHPRSLLTRLRSDKHGRNEFWNAIREDGLKNTKGWLLEDLLSSARIAVRRFVEGEDPFVDSLLARGTEEHKRVARKFLELCDSKCYYPIYKAKVKSGTSTVCILQLKGHTNVVTSVAFTPDCKNVVSGSMDNAIRIWDAATGQEVRKPLRGHKDWIWSVAVSLDGQRIVSGSDDRTVRIWDAQTGQEVAPSPLRGSIDIFSAAISPDGSRLIAASADGTIHVWDAETGESTIPPLKGHQGWVRSVAISPDGNWIVSGSNDYTVRVWDIPSAAEVMKMTGHTCWVRSVAISPDGLQIVSCSWDRTVRIWDAKTGQQVGEPLRGHTDWVNSVVFSPDGRRIVSGSDDRTIRVWDVETGKQVGKPLKGHTDFVYSVAISSDGKLIASGSEDKTVLIWDGE
ncbi:WD40 repeat-like protein, partial [Coprinopsis marcescibilis]